MGPTKPPPRSQKAATGNPFLKNRRTTSPNVHGLTKMGKFCQPKSSIGSWRIREMDSVFIPRIVVCYCIYTAKVYMDSPSVGGKREKWGQSPLLSMKGTLTPLFPSTR